MHASCFAVGIKKGDEVITTPMTFAASANCVLYCGGKSVFADINPFTYNIDPKEIEKKITSKTKAIIPVDFTGQAVHLQPYYKKLGYEEGLCSNVEDLYNKMITLPLHANMSDKDLQDVVLAVNKVLNYYKK